MKPKNRHGEGVGDPPRDVPDWPSPNGRPTDQAFQPIWIRQGDIIVMSVDCIADAHTFLPHFQGHQGGVFHATKITLEKCLLGEGVEADQAREAFWRFADHEGILAESAPA